MEYNQEVSEFEHFFLDRRISEDTMKPTMVSVACANIRAALRQLGYEIEDGNQYDEKLKKIVFDFQTDNNHSSKDGFFGPGTRKLLIQKLIKKFGTTIFKRIMKKDLLILFLGANPSSTSRLKLDKEIKTIQTNLKLAKKREHLELKQEWAVTTDSLMQAILDESPNIVHFSGHGQQKGILLQDEIGQPKLITTEAITSLFKLFKDSVTCVVLNACYSKTQAQAIKLHIPYVIGMKSGIPDKAAIAFSTGFYKAIGAGRDIPFAFNLGVAAIKLEGISGANIPVLL